jgi:hypothetical protein
VRDVLITVVKPLIISIATHPTVKNLVLELLKKYVDSTDNSIDNVVYELVKEKLFTPSR